MAPDGSYPEIAMIGGRRFRLRVDGNTCYYVEEPEDTTATTFPVIVTPGMSHKTSCDTSYYCNISSTGFFDFPEDDETIKRKRLRWLRFIRGPDWLALRCWPEPPRRTLRPPPRVAILQPWRWPTPPKPKLPPEVRRIRTEMRRLKQPRVPRACVACPGCYNGRVTSASITTRR